MYKGRGDISLSELREKVSDFQLASYYLGVKSIPCLINSPLREDRHPSFGIYEYQNKVYWKDLANKDKGSIYDLLSLMWHTNFRETLDRINRDLKNFTQSTTERKVSYASTVIKSNKTLNVKVREWRKYDLEYWKSYGISLKWLKYADVYPISHKIVTVNGIPFTFGAEKYAYVYVERKDNKVTLKIYQPLTKDKRNKWCNKHDKSVISLWTKVPKEGKQICICSSLKDALCLWANTGIPAISLQGEGYDMSKTAISELKRRYKNIYILFDNDKAGLEDGIKLSKQTGFTNLVLPEFEGGKDVSDLFKVKGEIVFKEVINKLFMFNQKN